MYSMGRDNVAFGKSGIVLFEERRAGKPADHDEKRGAVPVYKKPKQIEDTIFRLLERELRRKRNCDRR